MELTVFSDSSTSAAQKRVKSAIAYSLKNKYGIENEEVTRKILKIHGIDVNNFDVIANTERSVADGLTDTSVDQNSNKNEKTISGLINESITNPFSKILGYRYLYRKMKELYGKSEAKRLSGEMYDLSIALSDSTKILQNYCYAFDFTKLVLEGRTWGQLHSAPPKRLTSYIAALTETVHQLASNIAGAVAVSTFFLDSAHVMLYNEKKSLSEIKRSKKLRKYVQNSFQSFIHSVNHLSRNSIESPFTNISIFDKEKLKGLLDKDNMRWYFNEVPSWFVSVGGNRKEKWIQYVVDYINELQDIYIDFFDEGDKLAGGKPYRFPVTTLNVSKDPTTNEILDKKFLDKISKKEIFRYNIMVSGSNKFANCCFSGEQKVLVKNSLGTFNITFKELYENKYDVRKSGSNWKIFHNGSWVSGNIISLPKRDMFEIETMNNKKIVLTDNHINPTFDGEKATSNLTDNDYLMFNTSVLEAIPENDLGLTYEEGFLLGMYLGDGSSSVSKEHNGVQIHFSLNKKKYEECYPIMETALKQLNIDNPINLATEYNNVYPVSVNSRKLYEFIKTWSSGNYANEKEINLDCLKQSKEFRNGIVEGLYATDGGNSNRLYTTSEKMAEQLEIIFTSLGKQTIINVSDRIDEPVVIRGETFKRNFELICIRWYSDSNKRNFGDFYKVKNNSFYFKIKSIKKVEIEDDNVYCFDMNNVDEPYFTLPNGIITHNCRLISQTDMFDMGGQVSSLGLSAISLGSHRVATINFNRIALEAKDIDDYFNILSERAESAAKILKAHKELIIDTEKWGFQPFISNGYIKMEKMFSTFGVLGIVEGARNLAKKTGIDEKGILEQTLRFLNDKAKDLGTQYKISINIEQIPGETVAVKFHDADALIYGEEVSEAPLYSNQFLELWKEASIWERMDIDGALNKLYTGGGIVAFNISDKPTASQVKKLIEYSIKTGSEHFSLNAVYSECENAHTTFGNHDICPKCGGKIIEKYTRVVGFMTPISSWNNVRREWEFPKRYFSKV